MHKFKGIKKNITSNGMHLVGNIQFNLWSEWNLHPVINKESKHQLKGFSLIGKAGEKCCSVQTTFTRHVSYSDNWHWICNCLMTLLLF